MSWSGIPELKATWRRWGPLRFLTTAAALLGWAILGGELEYRARWSGACDHAGYRLIHLVKELHCSPELLHGGGAEIGLFCWLWSLPLFMIMGGIWAYVSATAEMRDGKAGR